MKHVSHNWRAVSNHTWPVKRVGENRFDEYQNSKEPLFDCLFRSACVLKGSEQMGRLHQSRQFVRRDQSHVGRTPPADNHHFMTIASRVQYCRQVVSQMRKRNFDRHLAILTGAAAQSDALQN
jgi:hypothetical protein